MLVLYDGDVVEGVNLPFQAFKKGMREGVNQTCMRWTVDRMAVPIVSLKKRTGSFVRIRVGWTDGEKYLSEEKKWLERR
jgi:hypothetical protein